MNKKQIYWTIGIFTVLVLGYLYFKRKRKNNTNCIDGKCSDVLGDTPKTSPIITDIKGRIIEDSPQSDGVELPTGESYLSTSNYSENDYYNGDIGFTSFDATAPRSMHVPLMKRRNSIVVEPSNSNGGIIQDF